MLTPVCAVAMIGLLALGARVQGERAQRLADVMALRAAAGQRIASPTAVRVTLQPLGGAWKADVRLPTTRLLVFGLRPVIFTARATAVARSITTVDGRSGAILVG